MELGYKAFLTKGAPKRIHVACVIATPEELNISKGFPDDKTTIWCAAIEPGVRMSTNISFLDSVTREICVTETRYNIIIIYKKTPDLYQVRRLLL